MTAAATTPQAPPMANAPEPAAGPDPVRAPAAGSDGVPPAQGPGRRWRDGALTNTILVVLGAAFVAVLTFALTSTNARITRLENKVDAGFERVDHKIDTKFGELDGKIDTKFGELDGKIDTKFGELDGKIGELDDKIDNIDLKLTALIAGLNRTAEVEAALEGSVLDPDTG